MATVKTRLFNIRIADHKHAAFKKYAAGKDMSMGKILLDYIDALLTDELVPLAKQDEEDTRKKAKWEDPLAAVRDQYQQGRDY